MSGGLFESTIEVPYLLIYTVVIVIGLMSWIIVWSRESKLEMRDHDQRQDGGKVDSPCSGGK